jgi:hypothetical protein
MAKMDDCIEAQWGLYIGYMRKTLDYNIIIITLTIIPLAMPSAITRHYQHLKSQTIFYFRK